MKKPANSDSTHDPAYVMICGIDATPPIISTIPTEPHFQILNLFKIIQQILGEILLYVQIVKVFII